MTLYRTQPVRQRHRGTQAKRRGILPLRGQHWHKLKEEFRDVTAQMAQQMSIRLHPKTSVFHIPEQDFFKYDPGVKSEVEYLTNAYHEYTSGFATSLARSTCEMLFEQYCEKRDDIEWVYKNGDTGQQYFSIVYMDGIP